MQRRLRVGVIGAGYFSQFHYDAWRRIPEVDVLGICDRDSAKAKAAAAAFPGARIYVDAGAMLDTCELDLVDIVTPPDTHLALVREASNRALPMICQKPLADTLDESEEIAAIAEAAGAKLIVHENFRFMPWFREARRLLASGVLGVPISVSFRLRPGDGQGPAAYQDRQPYFQKMPRFLIHETAIHLIDCFRFLMGEVTGVFARLRRINPAMAGEDAGFVLFEFEGGTTGLFDGNRHTEHVAENLRLTMGTMFVEGSDAVLRLDGDGRLWLKPHRGREREHAYAWARTGFGGDCVHALQAHVVAHLRSCAALENDARSFLRNVAVEDAIYRSHQEERWLAIGRPTGRPRS